MKFKLMYRVSLKRVLLWFSSSFTSRDRILLFPMSSGIKNLNPIHLATQTVLIQSLNCLGSSLQCYCTGRRSPRPALRGGGEVRTRQGGARGGRWKESTIHMKPLLFFGIYWLFLTEQLLRLSEAVIRNHTLVADSWVTKGNQDLKGKWKFCLCNDFLL